VVDLKLPNETDDIAAVYVPLSRVKRLADLVILRHFDYKVLLIKPSNSQLVEIARLDKIHWETQIRFSDSFWSFHSVVRPKESYRLYLSMLSLAILIIPAIPLGGFVSSALYSFSLYFFLFYVAHRSSFCNMMSFQSLLLFCLCHLRNIVIFRRNSVKMSFFIPIMIKSGQYEPSWCT
jgi:hypothetical protein